VIDDPVFSKIFNTVRDIDDNQYELQPLETYIPLIESKLAGKSREDQIKYIATIMQELDYLKTQVK
tara:strand:+ start:92 stop:289 length:198 start_codon:yes stop_codon:yes gene_type:complete